MRKKKYQKSKDKLFTSPGSLLYIGREVSQDIIIKKVEYNANFLKETIVKNVNECTPEILTEKVVWLDIDGLHDPAIVAEIGKLYHLHPLLLEDILNTEQTAKLEYDDADKYLFLVIKMLTINELKQVEVEHVALVLTYDYLISFQEMNNTDIFNPVMARLRASVGKTRKGKSDYLFYSLVDLIIDNYFKVLEHFNEQLETLEQRVIENSSPKIQTELYELKRELSIIRKTVFPLRDIFGLLIREETPLIHKETDVYLRDIHDHVVQVLETIDVYREMADNIQNIYFASLSNKMNSVMKTLTVFTAIFMPLTFIVGIYGMNFDNMPELHTANGYYYTLGLMALITIGLWAYFKWKKYL